MPLDAPTTAQLKADIDSGRTGDKVAAPDPAASPLGTDDEAAGTPASPGAIATARHIEGERSLEPEDTKRGFGNWIWFAGLCLLILVAALLIARF